MSSGELGSTELVRRGYDALSYAYRGDDDETGPRYAPWVAELIDRLPTGSRVLDVGCGNGVPVARDLAAAGMDMTGVDVSDVQIDRARTLVPDASFIRQDIAKVEFPAASFDAVVALYSIFHLPLSEQPALLQRMASWAVAGGLGLIVTGAHELTGTDEHWLGGDTPMWWSQTDAATYRQWLPEAGWAVTADAFIPEGHGGHQLFWVQRS